MCRTGAYLYIAPFPRRSLKAPRKNGALHQAVFAVVPYRGPSEEWLQSRNALPEPLPPAPFLSHPLSLSPVSLTSLRTRTRQPRNMCARRSAGQTLCQPRAAGGMHPRVIASWRARPPPTCRRTLTENFLLWRHYSCSRCEITPTIRRCVKLHVWTRWSSR